MTKIQEIHELLQSIQTGVSKKLKQQENGLEKFESNLKELRKIKNIPVHAELAISIEHTKGQLFEIDYILENFWDIISK